MANRPASNLDSSPASHNKDRTGNQDRASRAKDNRAKDNKVKDSPARMAMATRPMEAAAP
jgi:hypothetical protein